jgi:uncharacterized SAM-binding protein YcdF (DUF218 family)
MFVLLKIILWFIRPLVWAFILFGWALLTKADPRKKRLFIAGTFILFFFSNPFFIRALLKGYEPQPVPVQQAGRYSAGIVLGGFISYNMEEHQGFFNTAGDRFIQTALLYKTGHINKIIVPAGNGYIAQHGFKEAYYIRDRLVELGVPFTDIYTDTESRNTFQNAVYTKEILDTIQLKPPYLLISSAMHLPRAQLVYKKLGMPVVLFPCDYRSRSTANNLVEDYLLPSPTALQQWDGFLKELLGIMTYKLTGEG